jgi:alkanesulfonate monooxygenase SsuD/methylene tetrahydromethanopterin reductase-like flavin-dependent oxidoreductase (luciferase family)
MRAVWGPDPVHFEGRFYRIPEAGIGPKPFHPNGPRVLVGAAAPSAVERAARLGLGLTLVIFDWDMVRDIIATFRSAAGDAGIDADTLPVMLQVNGNVTEGAQDERAPLTGSPDQVASDLDRAAGLGVQHVYWHFDSDTLSRLPLLAQLKAG